jgi:hypothetical protein
MISNDGMLVNNKLEIMWRKVIMTYFDVKFMHSHGETEESHKNLQSDFLSLLRKLNNRVLETKISKI